jgi:hypothetical protein
MKGKLDPVTLEVIRNALPAIANEMAADLQRTSYNMMIYEVRDFCTALVDVEGELVSQNVGGVSHFVADLGVIIGDAVKRYGKKGFKPGDVLITNHQAVAGQHLNNVVVYVPYFFKGELLAFAMVRAHWIDVGGTSTGFGAGPEVPDPWQEGLQIDQLIGVLAVSLGFHLVPFQRSAVLRLLVCQRLRLLNDRGRRRSGWRRGRRCEWRRLMRGHRLDYAGRWYGGAGPCRNVRGGRRLGTR